MLARLLLLFVLVPVVELAILVQLGRVLGLWPTLALVVLTGFAGAALARAEGLRTVLAARRELAQGRVPGGALLDGLAILTGGALLLTPGLLTDVVGFALLVPTTRRWMQGRARRWLEDEVRSGRIQVVQLGEDVWTFGRRPGREGLDPRHEIEQREDVENEDGGQLPRRDRS